MSGFASDIGVIAENILVENRAGQFEVGICEGAVRIAPTHNFGLDRGGKRVAPDNGVAVKIGGIMGTGIREPGATRSLITRVASANVRGIARDEFFEKGRAVVVQEVLESPQLLVSGCI